MRSAAGRAFPTAVLMVAGALAAPVAAQTRVDPFQPPQPSFGVGSISGLLRGPATHPQVGPIGANQIAVDQTGDGQPDVIYDLPAAIQRDTQTPARWLLEDRLSPTQTVLYTRRAPQTAASPPVCDGDVANHQVSFHRLDVPPGMTLLGSACLRGPLSRQPGFFDPSPSAALRSAVIVGAPSGGAQEVAWFDLASGGAGEDNSTYQPNVSVTGEGVQMSPFGNAFFVRHRTSQAGQAPRYSIVDLCADRTGGSVTTRLEPAGASGLSVAHRIQGGDLFADVSFTTPPLTETFALTNCLSGPPPTFRRLTVTVVGSGAVGSNPAGITCGPPGGACQADFLDDTVVNLIAFTGTPGSVFLGWSGDCSGTALSAQVRMTADRSCTATFGGIALAISKTADLPAVAPSQTLTYTLAYANNGTAPAANVVVADTLPAVTTFVGASAGGVLSGRTVSWTLGTLAPGATGQVQLQVAPGCPAPVEIVNDLYSIDADAVAPVAGLAVRTPVAGASTSPVTVQVTSVPDRTPARRGDLITHTVTLTNTGPDDHPYLRLTTTLGPHVSLDALVDAGTGSFSFSPPQTLTWTGPLAAGASTSLVIRVRVDDCFQGPTTALGGGGEIFVYNGCSRSVGVTRAPAIPLQRPIEAAITIANSSEQDVARAGSTLDIQLTLTNNFATDEPAVSLGSVLPPGLTPVGNPPFVPPTDPGATWDAATRTVGWSGTVPGGATVTITVRTTLDASPPCRLSLTLQGTRGSCSDVFAGRLLLSVPEPPSGPYILALNASDGLYTWEPGVDRNYKEAMCVHRFEFFTTLGRGAGGDAWLLGLRSFRANLGTPALESFEADFLNTSSLSWGFPVDAVDDPRDGSVIFSGNGGGLKRFVPQTGQVTDIALPPFPCCFRLLGVEADGTIVAFRGDGLYRIDPANSGSPQVTSDPNYALGFVDRDADGDYVALAVRLPGSVEALVEIDPVAGIFTPIIADLDAATGYTTAPHGPLAVGSDGTIYVGRHTPFDIFAIDRSVSPPAVTALSTTGTVINPTTPGIFPERMLDFAFVGGAPPPPRADLALQKTASPDPVPAGSALTYTLDVANLGPDAAAQVVVSDPLPPGVTFDSSASSPTCSEAGGAVTCVLGTLANGAAAQARVVVIVSPAASGPLANTAILSSTTADPDAGNNLSTVTVSVTPPPPPTADLALAKTAVPDPLVVGQDLSYTLAVDNAGPADAPGVVVTDALPPILAFDPAGSSGTCSDVSGTVSCALGSVVDDGSASATIAVRPLLPADLAVARLEAMPAGPVAIGASLVYEIDVTNFGPGDAREVRLFTLAPAFDVAGVPLGPPLDAAIVAVHTSRGACAASGPRGTPPLQCGLGTLLPAETARVTVVVAPNTATTGVGAAGRPLTNAARVLTVGRDLDPHTDNDERTVAAMVLPAAGPDLGFLDADVTPPAPVVLGGALTYDLEIANFGVEPGADVLLYTLAAGFAPNGVPIGPPLDVTIVSLSSSQGTCADLGSGAGPVECRLGDLPPGTRARVLVVALPNSPTGVPGTPGPPLRNRSRVTTVGAVAGNVTDPHAANDEAALVSVVLPANGAADLGVEVSASPSAPLVRGGDLTYSIVVRNFGPDPAAEVVLYTLAAGFDPDGRPLGPPLDVTLVSITPSQGACADMGGGEGPVECLLGTLPAGGSAQVTVVARPDSATAQMGQPNDPLVNGASVTTAGALAGNRLDPNPLNDRATVANTVLELLPDTIDNAASVASGIADPAPANNSAASSTPLLPAIVAPLPQADLGVFVGGPAQGTVAVPGSYVVLVGNAGPSGAVGASVLIELSQGLTLTGAAPSQGSCFGAPTAFCALGTLAAGATATVTLTVVPDEVGGQAISAAVSAAGSRDPDTSGDRASLGILVGLPVDADLAVTKTAAPEPVLAGEVLDYVVTVTNLGPAAATSIQLVDVLPEGVLLGSAVPSQGACTQPAEVVCALGDLPAGAQATVTLVVSVRPSVVAGTVLINSVSVGAAAPDPSPANNSASATSEVVAPSGENMDPGDLGEQYAYGENVGWFNLEPQGNGGPGVEVTSAGLSGWMWGENAGWCSLSCANTGSCPSDAYGVTNDGAGTLAGWAWCENLGWLSFSCDNTSSCGNASYGVTIDPLTGAFAGQAWSENAGWISFGSNGAAPYRIVTSWRGQ